MITDNAKIIREKIEIAKLKSGRKNEKIIFVGVSKTRTVDEMHESENFIDAFGENKVQEAESKKKIYGTSKITWRLIGHLQNNKARKAIELFDSVDSVDSIELAERLNRISGELNKKLPVLIEVNTSLEASKSGVSFENFNALTEKIISLENLKLEGLMTIGPLTDDEAKIRTAFSNLRKLSEKAKNFTGLELPILSMGMSDDFELAILEGSTMVRIGTLLYGARNYNKI